MLSLNKHSIIRTIYLYLFSLVGLALLITGFVKFIDMGLKAYVFTQAEAQERLGNRYYYSGPISVARLEKYYEESEDLNEEELAILKELLADYEEWQEEEEKIDYLIVRRHQQASGNLAMILVGLPLYLYHWRIIRRETKETKEKE